MKITDIKDKIVNTWKEFSIDKALDFVKKNMRYFAAGALFIVLVLILVKWTGSSNLSESVNNTETESTAAEEYQVDAIPKVKKLISNYYTAYAAGDLETLQTYAYPISANEQSFISMFSQYVDSYENISCYTKVGLDNTSYLVSVYLEIKFAGVDTTAPGLDFFYVRTDEKGNLYIDNLYSQFNLLNQEQSLDTNIKSLIDSFEEEADVLALQTEVQTKYEEAVAADDNLSNMISTTIADAYTAWAATITPVQSTETPTEATEAPTTETPATETPATETPATETPAVETPVATSETVYTTDKVNVRADANETAGALGEVDAGTALTRTETRDDGWSKIDYNGTDAYIKSDYLSTTAPDTTAAPDTTTSTSYAEGTKITLSAAVNIRESMDESSSKVGTAFAGETVTVVMSYAEGWTKVSWGDKTGYIKTEVLN